MAEERIGDDVLDEGNDALRELQRPAAAAASASASSPSNRAAVESIAMQHVEATRESYQRHIINTTSVTVGEQQGQQHHQGHHQPSLQEMYYRDLSTALGEHCG